ncbi:MAG: hypothetical protein UX85_C0004G0195 [Candidatus Beckwithbacteria bacterium GW2011_GWB1_47_15]|uniref:Uncharacterized protein n=1 Tax=Candidatus Beckwithbacteria bacterium GW2011_GWB1_47_15 TaxID=1618371 RepID=A0A0G1U4N0_9BACT|nr:MAG: hypothetical protein UY43_C0001G0040 [Candidatus Beckwithbacteria bacterium GW2011_GWC1_49_16]KKU34980.1 MAG: hypothetical protein UX50_C0007G0015 [Candidatus Beckwithbacteria bacterium GW2011_GWA1_46_30]KKU61273.1 MAG: hypothetical protein UX85_C0004G0195 [Candidatus Beckwithbacteria bacterium GW2011_GWB1_47_15]KKU71431.1 MAG: hypothetical protein UX97_C0006G0015 [Candidatus Beckwithbacteria bacterium GW2011_GWA2_47_25]KKW03081.1 MAG: hypothetical protein UY37_C0007G0035 [Candidatus Be
MKWGLSRINPIWWLAAAAVLVAAALVIRNWGEMSQAGRGEEIALAVPQQTLEGFYQDAAVKIEAAASKMKDLSSAAEVELALMRLRSDLWFNYGSLGGEVGAAWQNLDSRLGAIEAQASLGASQTVESLKFLLVSGAGF